MSTNKFLLPNFNWPALEEGETRHILGSSTIKVFDDDLTIQYAFSEYEPRHPRIGNWCFWQLVGIEGAEMEPASYQDIFLAGLNSEYVRVVMPWLIEGADAETEVQP
jgi:hypothetical protein